MSLLYYLLEANLYLLIFYGFYRLFLYQETYYKINRYYLILATITAFFLPLLVANGFHEPLQAAAYQQAFQPPTVEGYMATPPPPEAPTLLENIIFSLPDIYLYIVAFFIIKLLLSIAKIAAIAYAGKKEKAGKVTIIALNRPEEQAFSFFNFLFINPALTEKQTVINHELAHIEQRHSFDILFFEILQAICWFNPIVWFIKSDIKLLHEYLADERTTEFGADKHAYAMYLIEHSFGLPSNKITNHIFNQSILKRRINMLNKERSTGRARLKLLLVLPTTCAMIGLSTMAFTKDYGFIDVYPEKYTPLKNNRKVKQTKQVPPPPQEPKAPKKTNQTEGQDKIYDYVSIEKQPQYPGGLDAFRKFLVSTIKYPVEAKQKKIEGTTYVTFTVERDGSLTDIRVERKMGNGLDEEAIRAVRLSRKWIPGLQNGRPVRVKYNVPVKFSLNKKNNLTVQQTKQVPPAQDPKAPEKTNQTDSEDKIYDYVSIERQPAYPGGLEDFRKWLGQTIIYPKIAAENKLQGTVYVTYTVEKDGSLTDVRVERKVGGGLDEEAIRVIKLSKRWIPGIQNGRPVRVKYNVPVKFSLK